MNIYILYYKVTNLKLCHLILTVCDVICDVMVQFTVLSSCCHQDVKTKSSKSLCRILQFVKSNMAVLSHLSRLLSTQQISSAALGQHLSEPGVFPRCCCLTGRVDFSVTPPPDGESLKVSESLLLYRESDSDEDALLMFPLLLRYRKTSLHFRSCSYFCVSSLFVKCCERFVKR